MANESRKWTDEWPPRSRRWFLTGIGASGIGMTGSTGAAAEEDEGPVGPTDTIECGQTISGKLTEDDAHGFHEAGGVDFPDVMPVPHDAYEFDASAGRHLTFSVDSSRSHMHPLLILLDPNQEIITLPTYSSFLAHPTRFRYHVPETGRYTILVTSRYAGQYFEYELSLSCQTTRELIGETEHICCGDVVQGELTSDDTAGYNPHEPTAVHDAYEVDLQEEEIVRARLIGDPDHQWEQNGLFNHADLDLLDENGERVFTYGIRDGRLISQKSNNLGESYLWGRVPADGRYTLLVTSILEAYFSYELGITCGPDIPIHSRAITCGETRCGDIQVDPDRFPLDPPPADKYEFEGRRGQEMTVRIEFLDGVRSLEMRDPRGSMVGFINSPESPIEMVIPSALEGIYTFDVSVPTSISPASNPYKLTLECEPDDLPEPDEYYPIDCGQSVVGELTTDDLTGFRGPEHYHDNYAFDGRRGQTVSLRMESEIGNGMLYLLDPDGATIAQTDGTGRVRDGSIDDVTLEQTGSYRIVATSRTSLASDATFEYTLTLFCTGSAD